jgi:hypothetical protein
VSKKNKVTQSVEEMMDEALARNRAERLAPLTEKTMLHMSPQKSNFFAAVQSLQAASESEPGGKYQDGSTFAGRGRAPKMRATAKKKAKKK